MVILFVESVMEEASEKMIERNDPDQKLEGQITEFKPGPMYFAQVTGMSYMQAKKFVCATLFLFN